MKNCKKLIAGMVLSLLTVLNTAGAFSVEASAEETQSNGSKSIVRKSEPTTRTVMLFLVGSNLESNGGCATQKLLQFIDAKYDENVNVIAVTGGTTEWKTDAKYLVGAEAVDPKLNQVWKVEGKKTGKSHGNMTLLEPEGLPGFEDTLISQPAALTAFIDYCYDNYKSDFYDIILMDHGGGPAGTYGRDTRYTGQDNSFDLAELIKSFDDSKLINDGQKFEILDFDACVMASVEIVTALYDFADNLVVSSDVETSPGQYLTPVFNAVRKDPSMNGFEIGKKIVDAMIEYDNDYYGNAVDATLSVINTDNYKKRLAGKLERFDDVLVSEARNAGANGKLNFYDELQALCSTINFQDINLFDMGGLAGAFSSPNVEADITSDEDYMLRQNAYTEAARDILSVLNDQDGSGDDVIYSRYSKYYIRNYYDCGIRGLDGELLAADENGYTGVSPTGLSVYFGFAKGTPELEFTKNYMIEMSDAISTAEDPAVRSRLTKRLNAVQYYQLIGMIGCAASTLKTNGVEKIDLSAVKTYLNTQNEGWDSAVEKLIDSLVSTGEFGSAEECCEYISALIAQQQKDYAAPGDISARRVMLSDDTSYFYRVDFNNCFAKTIKSLSSGVYVTLKDPFTSEFRNVVDSFYGQPMEPEKLFPDGIRLRMYSDEGVVDVGSGISEFEGSSIQNSKKFYLKDSFSCLLPEQKPISLTMIDDTGKQHIMDVKFYDDTFYRGYVPILIKMEGGYYIAAIDFSINKTGDGMIFTSLYLCDYLGNRYQYDFSSDMFEDASFAPCTKIIDSKYNEPAVPISSFIKIDNTKECWGLSIDVADYSEISDNDVRLDYHYEDIYGVLHSLNDEIAKADAEAELGNVVRSIESATVTVGEAVYDGTEQKPEVVVTIGEKVLKEGVDYNLFYDGSIDIGNAQVMITGIGDYYGMLTADYTIICPHSFELKRTKAATCTKKGKAEYKCSVCGEKKIEDIEPTGHEFGEWIVTRKPTTTKQGKKIRVCMHCGKIQTEAIPALQVDISKAEYRISNKKLYYTGSTVTPELKVAYRNKLLTEGTHYELTFENAVEPGKATFKINGIGQFTGTLTGEYIIIPAKVKIESASSDTAGTIDLSWVNEGSVDGYEILLYTTRSNGFVRSTETFSAAGSDSSIKITGLKSGKRLNVFVRAYKIIDGEPVYSKYGSSQSVTVS